MTDERISEIEQHIARAGKDRTLFLAVPELAELIAIARKCQAPRRPPQPMEVSAMSNKDLDQWPDEAIDKAIEKTADEMLSKPPRVTITPRAIVGVNGERVPVVPRADFDEALALLKEYAGRCDCGRFLCCEMPDPIHATDCRLAAFLKKWGK